MPVDFDQTTIKKFSRMTRYSLSTLSSKASNRHALNYVWVHCCTAPHAPSAGDRKLAGDSLGTANWKKVSLRQSLPLFSGKAANQAAQSDLMRLHHLHPSQERLFVSSSNPLSERITYSLIPSGVDWVTRKDLFRRL